MLLLCTANQCRSPMAEVLLRHHLGRAGAAVTVRSAGLHPGGHPATAHGVATMADRGLDLTGHVSRQLDRSLIAGADLVIGMTREHVREVAVLDPDALGRTLTLKELVTAGSAAGPRQPGEPLAAWLGRIGERRQPHALVGVGHDDALDVADPVGQGRARYEATADELDGLLGHLVELAWPATIPHGQECSA